MRQILLALLTMIGAASAQGAVPAGYYSRLDGKTGADLKTATCEVINPHTQVSSYSNLPRYFQTTDVYPQSMQWWDMYSNVVRYAPSFSGLNREHSFPKSWWKVGNDVEYTPAYTDLNHLYPSDGPANQAKSNYPLGTVDRTQNVKFDNNVTLVGYPVLGQGGGAQYVFEPDDEYKGDFARTYFYMVTCYQNLQWNTSYMWMLQRNTYPTLTPWAMNLLLKWHREDPVSQKEVMRNENVYGFQNNRNPFIDFPDLAEYIWGRKVGEPFRVTEGGGSVGEPTLTAPVHDTTLDFGQVAVGQTVKALLFFKGENISSPLSISLGGDDRAMFSLPERSIAASLVNAPGGYYLQVSYTPTAIGSHNARILIYDGGLTGSIYVYFKGDALETPILSRLTAYDAADITPDGYTASWSEAPETVDYYVVTRTRYMQGGDVISEEIECEETSVAIDDFNTSVQESYYVQSVRLGFRSEASNVVFVNHSGLSGVTASEPIVVGSWPGTVRITVQSDHTGCRIYDAAGRQIVSLPMLSAPGTELCLVPGVYFLVTDRHPEPIKLIAR